MLKKCFYPVLILVSISSIYTNLLTSNQLLQFGTSCISLLLWAALMGKATENVAHFSGERMGGVLNATFGNAAELIICMFLIKAGLFDMVKASITGAIIGNLLLVFGLSAFLGGLKYKTQNFNPTLAGHNSSLMILSVIALFVPAIFLKDVSVAKINNVSFIISVILIICYFLWLLFSLITHRKELSSEEEKLEHYTMENDKVYWPNWVSILVLAISTIFIGFNSEWIVETVKPVAAQFKWSELFIGAFVIAIIGNAAEHSAAILLAMRNKFDATVEIAIGSSLQIALFVAPVLVFFSFFIGNPMNIIFTPYELCAIAISVWIASSISHDGATNWYEGLLLLMVYCILGTVFFVI